MTPRDPVLFWLAAAEVVKDSPTLLVHHSPSDPVTPRHPRSLLRSRAVVGNNHMGHACCSGDVRQAEGAFAAMAPVAPSRCGRTASARAQALCSLKDRGLCEQ